MKKSQLRDNKLENNKEKKSLIFTNDDTPWLRSICQKIHMEEVMKTQTILAYIKKLKF